MTKPDKPTVGDLTARLEFRYENDPLDFLKTGKGYLVVDDKVATIPLPTGEKGEKGDTGRLAEGDVRYFNHRTDEAEAAAEAAKSSETNAKSSETKAKTSETNAKTSETNAKSSETKAKSSETNAKSSETKAKASEEASKSSETNAKSSETKAKASEEESTSQAELSRNAATLAITSAATLERHVADRDPAADDMAYKGAIWVAPDQVWIRGESAWYPVTANETYCSPQMRPAAEDFSAGWGPYGAWSHTLSLHREGWRVYVSGFFRCTDDPQGDFLVLPYGLRPANPTPLTIMTLSGRSVESRMDVEGGKMRFVYPSRVNPGDSFFVSGSWRTPDQPPLAVPFISG